MLPLDAANCFHRRHLCFCRKMDVRSMHYDVYEVLSGQALEQASILTMDNEIMQTMASQSVEEIKRRRNRLAQRKHRESEQR
jgi:23S rRNA maturation mini-RNase III